MSHSQGNQTFDIDVQSFDIDVQSAFSWTPKVARKCESKHWYACGADGRSVARSVGHVIAKFSGWVDLFTHGAPLARFARGAPL